MSEIDSTLQGFLEQIRLQLIEHAMHRASADLGGHGGLAIISLKPLCQQVCAVRFQQAEQVRITYERDLDDFCDPAAQVTSVQGLKEGGIDECMEGRMKASQAVLAAEGDTCLGADASINHTHQRGRHTHVR